MCGNPNGIGTADCHNRSLPCCGDENSHQTQPDNSLLIKQNKQIRGTSEKNKLLYGILVHISQKILVQGPVLKRVQKYLKDIHRIFYDIS
jgi:hypothetical protein